MNAILPVVVGRAVRFGWVALHAGLAFAALAVEPAVQRAEFGRAADGTVIDAFTLTNRHGAVAKVITYGAILTDLRVPDRDGKLANVVREVVFSETNYARGFPNAGMIAGRVANRIANARFTLDGHDYQLAANNGVHSLHGGRKGFGKVIWQGRPTEVTGGAAVTLTYASADGEEGYPGNMVVTATYTLTESDTLRLDYTATTDKPTPINLTNHAYFNLAGGGDVRDHVLTINAERYTVADATLIPTGEIKEVQGTPLDFTKPAALGTQAQRPGAPGHYDHSFVLNGSGARTLVPAASVADPKSGRAMAVWTTEPGIQLYTSQLGGPAATGAAGFYCLEPQHFPDSVHHPEFPSTILRPGETFRSTTEYRFFVTPPAAP